MSGGSRTDDHAQHEATGYANLMLALAIPRFGADSVLAATYAVACSGAEASLTNWENAGTSTLFGRAEGRQLNASERAVARRSLGKGDGVPQWGDNLDSMGLFAQRPMSGWGNPEDIMRPEYAIGKFYDALTKVAGWSKLPAAQTIAKVQGYYDASVYAAWLADAQTVIGELAALTPAPPAPTPDAPVSGDPVGEDDLMSFSPDQLVQFAASGFARAAKNEKLPIGDGPVGDEATPMTLAEWCKQTNDRIWRIENAGK